MDSLSISEGSNTEDFDCGQCGAHLTFEPGTTSLKCQYCDHENKIDGSEKPAFVEEKDLNAYLNSMTDNATKQTVEVVSCPACNAGTTLPPNITSASCGFCGTPLVLSDAKSQSNRIAPQYLLPFKVNKKEAAVHFRDWIKSLWFAPNALKRSANSLKKITGMYLPFWTYDASTTTNYTGQRGDYYYTTESYTDNEGNRKTRRVQHTRWSYASGTVFHLFDDVLVAGTQSVSTEKLDELEPWDLHELKHYDEAYLSGFVTEQYSLDVKYGLRQAKLKMQPMIRELVERDIGGDTQRIGSSNTRYSNLTFKHILLPTWISSYRFKDKVYQFLVNARTGEVQGERPWSVYKIAAATLFGLSVAGGLTYAYMVHNGYVV
ncbi:hypothetical protein A9Q99_19600 [Gammaproteobacteria bacterium 45_16_T64]|nr:hypothetical protein A9Q99_19600 [Gammaproteobacteria bacterium 45_16_T64]